MFDIKELWDKYPVAVIGIVGGVTLAAFSLFTKSKDPRQLAPEVDDGKALTYQIYSGYGPGGPPNPGPEPLPLPAPVPFPVDDWPPMPFPVPDPAPERHPHERNPVPPRAPSHRFPPPPYPIPKEEDHGRVPAPPRLPSHRFPPPSNDGSDIFDTWTLTA